MRAWISRQKRAEEIGNDIDRLVTACFRISRKLVILSLCFYIIWYVISAYKGYDFFWCYPESLLLGVTMWLADGALVYAVRFIPLKSIPRILYRVLLTAHWLVYLLKPEVPIGAKLLLFPFCFSALLWGAKTDGLVMRYKALRGAFRLEESVVRKYRKGAHRRSHEAVVANVPVGDDSVV